jgi:hypothetical protein
MIESSDPKNIRTLVRTYFTVRGAISINANGSVDIAGNCHARKSLQALKSLPLKFNAIAGDFLIDHSDLTSLQGGPETVGGTFNCYENKLTSLQGCPNHVGKDFICSSNKLIILSDKKFIIGGGFYCNTNSLTSLGGGPAVVGFNYDCSANPLTSLDGLPDIIHGELEVDWHQDLALLKLLKYHFLIINPKGDGFHPTHFIMKKYANDPSRKNILACQKELIDAGFEGNASW